MEGAPQQFRYTEEITPEQKFNEYLDTLKISLEDLRFPLLDVGANTGEFVTYCRETLGHKDCFGIEPVMYNPEHVKGLDNGIFDGTAQDIPVPSESFEMVVSKHVMPMFKKDFEMAKKAVEEMLRILKPGGELVFNFWSVPDFTKHYEEHKKNIVVGFEDVAEKKFQEIIAGIDQFEEYLEELREEVKELSIDEDSVIKIIK